MTDEIKLLLSNVDQGGPHLASQLTNALRKNFDPILNTDGVDQTLGLDDDVVDDLIQFFISPDSGLGDSMRISFLEAIIPESPLSFGNVEKLLYWCFSNVYTKTSSVAIVFNWIYTWAKYQLIDVNLLVKHYSVFLCYIKINELVSPVCNILTLMNNPKLVKKQNISLLKKYYHLHPESIGKVLHLYNSINPTVDFKKKIVSTKPSCYDGVIKKISAKLGYTVSDKKIEARVLEVPVYSSSSISLEALALPKVSDITSPNDLGENIEHLVLPDNELSLLSSNGGVMYLTVKGPSEKFLSELDLRLHEKPSYPFLVSIVGLQKQLMYGLPPVTDHLSRFLSVWDGDYQDQIVYNLIPWLHFNTFDELKSKILIPLFRVFITSLTNVKIEIIDVLAELIQNMITIHMEKALKNNSLSDGPLWLEPCMSAKTVTSVIDVVHSFIEFGVAKEGLECTSLIHKVLEFYQKMVNVQLECSVVYFFLPPPSVFYGAMASINLATLNSLCSLITSYKEVVDFIITIDESVYETEIATLTEYSTKLYAFIWADNDDFADGEEEKSVGKYHMAIYPFVHSVLKSLGKNPTDINKENTMEILKQHAKGIAKFIKMMEGGNE